MAQDLLLLPISVALSLCLNYLLHVYLKLSVTSKSIYCDGIYSRTGVNCFWIVDNSQQVLSSSNKVNYFSTAKHFDSYDFSTLYTSIPNASLKEALTSIIIEANRVRDNTFLVVDSRGKAYWSDIPSKTSSPYSI